jgi:hypothetical protein
MLIIFYKLAASPHIEINAFPIIAQLYSDFSFRIFKKSSLSIRPCVAKRTSHWLPIAAARFEPGIFGAQSGTEAGFIRVIWLPLPTIPPIVPSSSSISGFENEAKEWPTYHADSVSPHSKKIK